MRSTKLILQYSIALIFLLPIFGCTVNPVTDQKELMLITEAKEIEIGKELYPNVLWSDLIGGGEYKDEKLKTYLKNIVVKVHSVSHRPSLPIQFTIQNSSKPNAWAVPGYVVITRGLLAALDNEAEFAFVVGHEIGHISAMHSAKQITREILQQIGVRTAGIAFKWNKYSDVALGLGSIGSNLLLLKYSRDDELEADKLGILYMTKLGYAPEHAINAHKNLEKASQEYIKSLNKDNKKRGLLDPLFSTHPRSSTRIEEIQRTINELQVSVLNSRHNKEKFQTAIAELKNINKIYIDYYDKAVKAFAANNIDDAENFVSDAIMANEKQPAFHALMGFIELKRKNYHNAEKSFVVALTLDEDYEPALRGMGAIKYYKREYLEGIEYLKKGISLFPLDVVAHYFLGMSYYKMRMHESAIPHLSLFAEMQPKHPEIHGVLGICYENINDLHQAYKEYATQLTVNSTNEMGRYAESRIVELRAALKTQKMK